MSGRAIWIVLGIAKPPLLTSSSDGSTLFPSTSTLTSDEAVISSYSMPKRLIRKWSCGPGTRAVMRVLIRSDQADRSADSRTLSSADPGHNPRVDHNGPKFPPEHHVQRPGTSRDPESHAC